MDEAHQEPRPAQQGACGDCGHPFALHSNGRTACCAYACTAGPDGAPCPAFVPVSLVTQGA